MSERVTTVPQNQPRSSAQPRISYRSLGISTLFFSLLAGVGALANWSSGKGLERAAISAALALTLLVIGILMLKYDTAQRR